MKTYHLHFKWTVSRGRDTYGYNICTLRVDGIKAGCCNGGGYDMEGTALGEWIESAFADRLLKLKESFYGLSFHDPNYDPGKAQALSGKTVEEAEKAGETVGLERYQAFYAASSKVPTKRHTVPGIDGACGISSVQKIGEAIGLKFIYKPGGKSDTFYIVEDHKA